MTELQTIYTHLMKGMSLDTDTAHALYGIKYLNSLISILENERHIPIDRSEIVRPHKRDGRERPLTNYSIPLERRLELEEDLEQVMLKTKALTELKRRLRARKTFQRWIQDWGVDEVLMIGEEVFDALEIEPDDRGVLAIKKEAQK